MTINELKKTIWGNAIFVSARTGRKIPIKYQKNIGDNNIVRLEPIMIVHKDFCVAKIKAWVSVATEFCIEHNL